MRTRGPKLAPPFVFTALVGSSAAVAAPTPQLPASRQVDPVERRADGSCWQAKDARADTGCAPDAKKVKVRCPPPALGPGEALLPFPPGRDGTCYATLRVKCPANTCVATPEKPCPPLPTCNPPPPRPVPCPGEGDASQIHQAGEPPPPRPAPPPRIERNADGTCTLYPHIPADFRCPEGATCNPPMPYQVPCPPVPPGEFVPAIR